MHQSDIAALAFERAWRVYQLIDADMADPDARRLTLERFVRQRCEQGAADAEPIVVAALQHLKSLDADGRPRDADRGVGTKPGKSGTSVPRER